MPIYNYVCEICNKEEELFQSMNSSPPQCCDCDIPMKKIIVSVSIRTRGAGLYSLDKPSIKSWGDYEK